MPGAEWESFAAEQSSEAQEGLAPVADPSWSWEFFGKQPERSINTCSGREQGDGVFFGTQARLLRPALGRRCGFFQVES